MSATNKLIYLKETKELFKNTFNPKGADIKDDDPFRVYPDKIEKLFEWQPEPDWWDIEKIIKDDTEDYPAKIIWLLNNSTDTSIFNSLGAAKITYSDNTHDDLTANTDINITHSWDSTYDKDCHLGYKTRYMIMYFSQKNVTSNASFTLDDSTQNQFLYLVLKDININCSNLTYLLYLLKYIKFVNSSFVGKSFYNVNNFSLVGIDEMKAPNLTAFQGSGFQLFTQEAYEKLDTSNFTAITGLNTNRVISNLKLSKIFNLENIINYSNAFNGSFIISIDKLDFTNATTIGSFVSNFLISVKEIVGSIKVNINISSSQKIDYDTLMKFSYALYDYSDSEETHTFIIGAKNIEKLGEAISIATNKGWTVS